MRAFPNNSGAGTNGQAVNTNAQGIFNPVVGSGADYEIDKKDGSKNNISIAVVGKEPAEGKDGYWLETTADDPRMGTIVMKMLLVVDGNSSHAAKMVMQMPGRRPIEMPMGMGGRMPMAQQPEDIRDKADDLGSESVTVPAGTFTCEHYRGKQDGDDVWVSKDAPPYGLVKMVQSDKSTTMVLTKVESNVQDKITGTPQPFNPMMMGRGQPPQ